MEDDRSENAELLALQKIDEAATQLQQQGNYVEALECMERGLVLRQHFFGADSDEVWRACKTVGEMCNLLAMTYLQQEDFNMALELLKKAEILTERDPPGRAVTFNNMACYYRRMGKLHVALTNLTKALKIESRLQKVDNPADTHLNMCAVLSQLGRHQGALEHAQSSLILLQEELFGSSRKQEMGADRVAVLAIAYHNIGVEQEFLKKFDQSILSYKKGVEFAEQHLGAQHGITVTVRNSLIAAKRAHGQRQLKNRTFQAGASTKRGNRSSKNGSKKNTLNASKSKLMEDAAVGSYNDVGASTFAQDFSDMNLSEEISSMPTLPLSTAKIRDEVLQDMVSPRPEIEEQPLGDEVVVENSKDPDSACDMDDDLNMMSHIQGNKEVETDVGQEVRIENSKEIEDEDSKEAEGEESKHDYYDNSKEGQSGGSLETREVDLKGKEESKR